MKLGRVYRFSVANIVPGLLARRIEGAGLAGTVVASTGVSDWGVEQGSTAEIASLSGTRVLSFLRSTLRNLGEECAYLTIDGADPQLVYGEQRVGEVA